MDVSEEIQTLARTLLKNVRPSGPENIMAICPFHRKPDGSEEKTPSFSMSVTKGVYYCHQCHEKGGPRKFLKEMGYDASAIDLHYGFIIEEAAKNLPERDEYAQVQAIFTSSPIDEMLLGLFEGYDVSEYFPGYAKETLEHFNVCWDGWYHRILFPIRNLVGDLVALSGRAIYKGQQPRYKIYDKEYGCWNHPLRDGQWKKSSVLWHAQELYPKYINTLPGVGSKEPIYVVEGFKAAMWLWQCGYKNVVALLGSYMSWEQEWMLVTLGCPVYIFLDNDNAGFSGQRNAAKRLYPRSPVYMVEYPERLVEELEAQPDDLTLEELNEAIANAPVYAMWREAR